MIQIKKRLLLTFGTKYYRFLDIPAELVIFAAVIHEIHFNMNYKKNKIRLKPTSLGVVYC